MRILITGATGLIGSHLGRHLVALGHQINVLTRDPLKAGLQLPFPAKIFSWPDITQLPPSACFDDVGAVVHLAGEPVASGRWSGATKKRIFDSRILSTRSLLQGLSQYQKSSSGSAPAFVLGSAIGIYGDQKDQVLAENTATDENAGSAGSKADFLSHVVREWEGELKKFISENSELKEMRTSVVRTGIVLAEDCGALQKMLPIFQMGLGGRLGSGQHFMSWIHLDDIVRVFSEAALNPKWHGIINATAPHAETNAQFTIALADALEVSTGPAVPEFALRLLYGEMADVVMGSQRVIPSRAIDLGFEFRYPRLPEALADVCRGLAGGNHLLTAAQWVPKSRTEIFPFFSDEMNLEKLTPALLNFKVLGKSTNEIQQGTLIDYQLGVHGIPLRWQTLIDDWTPATRFVDTQLKGPYAKWHHTHEFHDLGQGTLLTDRVLYRLPLGRLGDLAAGWKVLSDVQTIFTYRRKVIGDLFGTAQLP